MGFIDKIVKFVGDGLVINVSHIIIQMCATLILFFVVRKWLWKPITELLEKRRELINKELIEAKNKNLSACNLELETKNAYLKLKEESKAIINEAIKTANLEKEAIIAEAKKEANRRLERADLEIKNEINDAKNQVKNEIVDIAFMISQKIVGKEISKNTYQDLVNEIIEGLVL